MSQERAALIIPIQLDAMVIDGANAREHFRRWRHRYVKLREFRSSEPAAFEPAEEDTQFGSRPDQRGVYLLWTLPAALRHKSENENFPLIPNRWVVLRAQHMGGRRKSWLIESDFINRNNDGNLVEDGGPHPCSLGRCIPNPKSWQEPGHKAFLTAFGPNGAQGLFYQPQAENILSFLDSDPVVFEKKPLSYTVIGWHSSLGDDPLHQAQGGTPSAAKLARFLESRQWELDASKLTPASLPTLCFYRGAIRSVITSERSRPRPAKVKMSIGAYPSDALRSHVTSEATPDEVRQAVAAALHDQSQSLSDPDGTHDLIETMHESQFGSLSGGLAWEARYSQKEDGSAKERKGKKRAVTLSPAAERALGELNETQATLNLALRNLESLQRDTHEVWWNYIKSAGQTDGRSQGFNFGGLEAQFEAVKNLEKKRNDLEAAARKAISQERAADGTPCELHSVQLSRFHYATDPCLIFEGLEASPFAEPKVTKCRTSNQILDDRSIDTWFPEHLFDIETGSLQRAFQGKPLRFPPSFQKSSLPLIRKDGRKFSKTEIVKIKSEILAEVRKDPFGVGSVGHGSFVCRLSGEAWLCEYMEQFTEEFGKMKAITLPNRFARPTAGPSRPIPFSSGQILRPLRRKFFEKHRENTKKWQAPWLPLFLEWEVEWTPIPLSDEGKTWQFDGFDYVDDKAAATPAAHIFGGRALLSGAISPSADDLFTHSPKAPEVLKNLLGKNLWISGLRGLHMQMAGRNPLPHLTVGTERERMLFGRWHTVPNDKVDPASFDGMRGGRFRFKQIQIVDRFGQTCRLFPPSGDVVCEFLRSDMLAPRAERSEKSWPSVQLPPRILQAARVEFECDPDIGQAGSRSPGIIGWLLPNHLDRSISVLDPNGKLVTICQQRKARTRPRHEDFSGTGEQGVPAAAPYLEPFLKFLSQASGFDKLMTCFQKSQSLVQPEQILGEDVPNVVLIGRPVALVAVRLAIRLAETPLPKPLLQGKTSLLDRSFTIHLGNPRDTGDGLLALWEAGLTEKFHDVMTRHSAPLQVRCSGPNSEPHWTRTHLLIEPGASVHAYSGLLPVKELRLRAEDIESALLAMEVPVRTGPILTHGPLAPVQRSTGNSQLLEIRQPDSRNGRWVWKEAQLDASREDLPWAETEVTNPSPEPAFGNVLPVLREGFLIFQQNSRSPSLSSKEATKDV